MAQSLKILGNITSEKKLIVILFFCVILLLNRQFYQPSILFTFLEQKYLLSYSNTLTPPSLITPTPTNLSHIVFGIVGSMNTLGIKRPFIESWWRWNATRGYLFLERAPTEEFQPWPATLPPFRVNQKIKELKVYPKLANPSQVRIVRTILETFKQGDKNVRWFVMADDDTVLFVDNIVDALAKYDHTKYLYIGTNSECIQPNSDLSFNMAYGGAGIALSYPLAQALASTLDECIEKYPYLLLSDFMLHTCLIDLGIDHLVHERGFHQNDFLGDISGLLSAHPRSPILSLHHIDRIDPIFPSMNHSAAINHLMKAAKIDHLRLVQQTICYKEENRWSVSVSWGYSVHLYEDIYPRSFLRRPLETFRPWLKSFKPPFYMFKTRPLRNDSCRSHVFFFESVESVGGNQVLTTYVRASLRNLQPLSVNGSRPADHISTIQVFSPAVARRRHVGVKEFCKLDHKNDANIVDIYL